MLTAAALSITVGVLVGAVITIGSHARSQSGATPSPSAQVSDGGSDSSQVRGADGLGSEDLGTVVLDTDGVPLSGNPVAPTAPAAGASVPTAALSSPSASTGAAPTTGRPPAKATPRITPGSTAGSLVAVTKPAVIMTTVTVMASTSAVPPTPRTTPTNPTTPASRSPGSSPPPATTPVQTAPGAGAPAAGQPCPDLGDKGTVAGGSNVFCQKNFANGTLAWRPVVDGGGCLSKRMRGIGIDGRHYACRPDGAGLDHWHPVG